MQQTLGKDQQLSQHSTQTERAVCNLFIQFNPGQLLKIHIQDCGLYTVHDLHSVMHNELITRQIRTTDEPCPLSFCDFILHRPS